MSNNIQLTAEQAEEEFGPLWDVLGMVQRYRAPGSRIWCRDDLHMPAWYMASEADLNPVYISRSNYGIWIGVEQARILKQLLLGK